MAVEMIPLPVSTNVLSDWRIEPATEYQADAHSTELPDPGYRDEMVHSLIMY